MERSTGKSVLANDPLIVQLLDAEISEVRSHRRASHRATEQAQRPRGCSVQQASISHTTRKDTKTYILVCVLKREAAHTKDTAGCRPSKKCRHNLIIAVSCTIVARHTIEMRLICANETAQMVHPYLRPCLDALVMADSASSLSEGVTFHSLFIPAP